MSAAEIPEGPDSLDITPERALTEALADCRKDPPDKAIIIKLWDEGGNYTTSFINAGMSASQVITLLEVMKARMVRSILES
jgi:hypothetical protein